MQQLDLGYSGDWMGRLGDRRTRRLFPAEYRTADRLKHWIGRAATRVTYRAGDDFEVLWISRGQQLAADSVTSGRKSSRW